MPKLNKQARDFLAEQDATGAAVADARKKAKRKESRTAFVMYLAETALRIKANGNIAGAKTFCETWRRILKASERRMFDRAVGEAPRDA